MAEKRYPMLSFRVSHEEKERAKALAKKVKKRVPQLTESDVFRELMGFTNTGLITEELRATLLADGPQIEIARPADVTESKIKPHRAGQDRRTK